MAEFKPIEPSEADKKWIELDKIAREYVALSLGVPSELFNDCQHQFVHLVGGWRCYRCGLQIPEKVLDKT